MHVIKVTYMKSFQKIHIDQEYLTCQEGGSNKFYLVTTFSFLSPSDTVVGHIVEYRWGKIGTSGQSNILPYRSHSATARVTTISQTTAKVEAKIKKGYKRTSSTKEYDHFDLHNMTFDTNIDAEVLLLETKVRDALSRETAQEISSYIKSVEGELKTALSAVEKAKIKREKKIEEEAERKEKYGDSWGAWA